MHPSKDELSQYVNKSLDDKRLQEISSHVCKCEFCKEYIEEYMVLSRGFNTEEKLSAKTEQLRETLFEQAFNNKIIPLFILKIENETNNYHIAADGTGTSTGIENISTLYSEYPEVVLRLMRDNDKNLEYIQLIADDVKLASHVVVEVPELKYRCITDKNGKALIENGKLKDIAQNKWQIKLPDAVFSMEPIVYDPDKTEYLNDMILETEKNDKIKVTLEGKTEGKQITIEILSLDGKDDFGKVNVAVIQDDTVTTHDTTFKKSVSFKIDKSSEIKIRLFQ